MKASGLAAGKGVVVAATKEEACQAVDEILTDAKYGSAGQTVVVEEFLEGDEVSVSIFILLYRLLVPLATPAISSAIVPRDQIVYVLIQAIKYL